MKNNKILDLNFFNSSVLEICPQILGKHLVQKNNKYIKHYIITEIEAYDGLQDLASHARFGKTKRNKPMFGPAGHFYVYLIYGMHWMLNVVTGPTNYPAAILIRSTKEISGPGKLTKALKIDKTLNNMPAEHQIGLWFESNNIKFNSNQIITTPRIGVNYAGPLWSKKNYRFVLKI